MSCANSNLRVGTLTGNRPKRFLKESRTIKRITATLSTVIVTQVTSLESPVVILTMGTRYPEGEHNQR